MRRKIKDYHLIGAQPIKVNANSLQSYYSVDLFRRSQCYTVNQLCETLCPIFFRSQCYTVFCTVLLSESTL